MQLRFGKIRPEVVQRCMEILQQRHAERNAAKQQPIPSSPPVTSQPSAPEPVAAKPKAEEAPAEVSLADEIMQKFKAFQEAQRSFPKDEPLLARAESDNPDPLAAIVFTLPLEDREAWVQFTQFFRNELEGQLKKTGGVELSDKRRTEISELYPDLAEKYFKSGAVDEKAPSIEVVKAGANEPSAVDAVSDSAGVAGVEPAAAASELDLREGEFESPWDLLGSLDLEMTMDAMFSGMTKRGINPMARCSPVDFDNKRIISSGEREKPPDQETGQSVPKGAADGVQGLEILNVDLDTILEAFKDQAKDSQIKTPPHPLVQYGMARLPIEHHQSWREFAEASALQVEQELEELVAAQLTETQRARLRIYFPELATRFLGEKPSAGQERRVDVLPALKERLGHSLRAEIVGAHFIQGKHGCFLELTEERGVAGYLPDRIVKRSDLSFISDQASADGLYFSPQQLMTVNVERLVDFDLWSMANCTDILTSQAAEEAQPDEEDEDEDDDEAEDDDLDLDDDDDDEGEAR